MLLPDNINPKYTLYYNGSLIIKELKNKNSQSIFGLYENIRKLYNISFTLFILSLDWLYLIDVAKINQEGEINLCSLNH